MPAGARGHYKICVMPAGIKNAISAFKNLTYFNQLFKKN